MVVGQPGEFLMKDIKIENKTVGENHPVFIIAEAGVNHNGEFSKAKKLVDIAVGSGVDAVKFQTYTAENVTIKNVKTANYVKNNFKQKIDQLNLLKNLSLSDEEFVKLKNYCDKKKIIFLSTPHSFDAIDKLSSLVSAYKFGSGDLTNIPSLVHAAKKKKPMILGTGMATLKDVSMAVDEIKKTGNNKIVLLHCTTNYPCSYEDVNLNSMLTMKEKLNCLVGYSDHTLGLIVPAIATALGATVIEKHFTIDKNLAGPDHKASLSPNELKQMVDDIRKTEKILGSFEKKPTASEKEIAKIVRKSIVATGDILIGTKIKRDMLEIKRPGTGIKPSDLQKIMGRKVKKSIKKDELIKYNMLE